MRRGIEISTHALSASGQEEEPILMDGSEPGRGRRALDLGCHLHGLVGRVDASKAQVIRVDEKVGVVEVR
jgi:hypothetical protein